MAQTAKLIQDTLAVAEKLPKAVRRQLAEKLLQRSRTSPATIIDRECPLNLQK